MNTPSRDDASCTASSPDDPERLAALRSFGILDTPSEAAFDRITELAAHLFDAPIAAVNFIDADRQWSKSVIGADVRETDLEGSFCVHAIQSEGITVVEDATENDRFADHPFVAGDPGIRFYAGAPLETDEGYRLGTLCVLDTTPHAPSDDRLDQFQNLAAMVMDELELRKEVKKRKTANDALRDTKRLLEKTLESLEEAVVVVDPSERQIIACNAAVEQIFGYDKTDLIGASTEMLHVDHEAYERFGAISEPMLDAEGVFTGEYRMQRQDGRIIVTEHTVTPLQGTDWRHGVVSVIRDVTERKDRERRFRSLVQNMPGVVYQLAISPDDTLSIPYISPSIETLTGVSPERATDNAAALLELMPPADRAEFAASIRDSADNLEPWRWEGRYTAPNGELRWFQAASQPRTQRDGTILWEGLLMDVTERKRNEQELRRSRERLAHVQEIAHLGSWERDLRTGALHWSDETRRIFGWDPDEPVKFEKFMATVHPEDRVELRAQQERLRAHGESIDIEFRIKRPDGEERFIHERGAATFDEHGVMIRLTGTVLDITERKRREKQLEEHRRRLQALFNNALDAIMLVDDDGRYVEVNPAACELVGYSRDELLGMNIWELTPETDQEEGRALWEAFIVAGKQEGKYALRRKDGSMLTAEFRAVANVVPGLHLSVLRDITDRVEYEEGLVRAKETAEEMNQLKSAFLANMSHEIRTPLTSIIGFSELLRDMDLPASAEQFTDLILRGGRRLLNTLNSVLDLSQLEAGSMTLRPEDVNLRPLVRNLVDSFTPQAHEADVELNVVMPSEPIQTTIDPTALRRVVSNLVSNAIKFTEAGGRVTVRLADRAGPFVLEVEDTGVGIDPEFVPHLFEAFNQESTGDAREFEGSGLGLTITKRLVDLMGGIIDVESVKGEGTTFTVRLPREKSPETP